MKSFLYALLLLLLTVLPSLGDASGNPAQTASFTPKLIEAEHGAYEDFALISDAGASNGKFLRIATSGRVRWNVAMEYAGWYLLKFRYKAPSGEHVNYFTKNDRTSQIGFGYATGWNINEWRAKLDAGDNTLELYPNWGSGMDLDYLEIDSVEFALTMTPVNNVFYQAFPRDIVAKINTYGRTVASVTADNQELEHTITEYPHQEDAYWVRIKASSLATIPAGSQQLSINLDGSESLTMNLSVLPALNPAPLTIIVPDISHGAAVIVCLPTGKTLLIDCATAAQRDQTLIPLLHGNNIDKIDYFILTHYHEDHDASDRGAKIKSQFNVDHFYDNTTVKTGQTLDIERTQIKILNTGIPAQGADLNPTSIALRLEYNGFVYHHGGDCYASQQVSMLNAFPGEIRSHLFHANHHFHGSSDVNFMRTMDPYLVLVQAEQAIYARSTYMMIFKKQTAEWLRSNNKRFIEDAPCLEVGTVVVRAWDEDTWTYETYFENEASSIPYIQQTMEWSEDRSNPPQFVEKPDFMLTVAAKTVEVEFVTDKRAFLRFSETDQTFDDMPHEFETVQGAIYHTATLSGENGECKTYYVRAKDMYGNESGTSMAITVTYDLSLTPIYWYEPDYLDSEWKLGQGPIGYGNSTDHTTCETVRALYMCKTFELTDSLTAVGLGVFLKGHDGIIAYLNGRQIASLNMTTLNPDYDSYASNEPVNPLTKVVVLDAEILKQLRIGQNILAMEVHHAEVANPTISGDARVFNNIKIYADLNGDWRYYDAGASPPVLTYRDVYTGIEEAETKPPERFEVSANYPNPFNNRTTFQVTMLARDELRADAYNVRGQKVSALFHDMLPKGQHTIIWEAESLPTGLYFVQLETPETKKLVKTLLLR
ncbi:T9SS type A sorting domain-containing protein [candidate division KSB1 bacterium]|nr:T9SS type A sorting domain-containing protein [candidate division KSB1 bacterium]